MTGIPSHPDTSEVYVPASILQYAEALPLVRPILEPDDCHRYAHKLILRAAYALTDRREPVDLVTVVQELMRTGTLEQAGGWGYAEQLASLFAPPINLEHHARRVRQRAIADRAKAISRNLPAQLDGNGMDPAPIIAATIQRLTLLQSAAAPPMALESPVAILRRAREQGEPIPTGIPALDERLRGGMRPGKTLAIGGTAGAGKTALGLQIAKAAAEAGCAVACHMADEGREPAVIRLGQQLGYIREQIEAGMEGALAGMEQALAGLTLIFPDPDAEASLTMEGVTEALVNAYPGRRGVLFLDSIQTVRTRLDSPSLRERIMENARTARRLAVEHNLIVIYTSEVNRSWYRSRKEEDRASDLAAFAEARIEFSADVLLAMRSGEQDPDLVEVRIPKNRLGHRAPFLLRLDRKRATLTPVDGDPAVAMREAAEAERIDKQTQAILQALKKKPGMTQGQLWEVVRGNRKAFLEALDLVRKSGLVRWEPEGRSIRHFLATVPA